MKKKEIKTKSIAYMPINDPKSFRRHILLSSIDVIKILEKYENLKQIRNEKKNILVEFKQKLNELNENVNNFKELVPKVNKHELKREEKEVEQRIEKIKYPKKSEGYKHLQRELQELQEKLSKIGF